MVKALLFLFAAQAGPSDRLAPILERWRSGREEDRLNALREAASLRKELGDAALAKFAESSSLRTWARPGDLLEIVTREKIPAWTRLVVPLLRAPETRTAWDATYALLTLGARDRVPEIAPLLKDEGGSLRPNVLYALLHLGSRDHAALLAPYLGDEDPAVAAAAVQALGRFRAREYAPKIVPFLEADDPSHRQAAITALAEMGDRDQAGKIAERLSDTHTLVRWEAVRALGRLKAREYAGQIVSMADENGAQAPVLDAMGALGLRELSPHILPFLDFPEPGIRWRAVKALGGVDAKDDAPRLAEMLKDEDSYVRISALQSLAAMGAREQVGPMIALLRDEEIDVCKTVAEEASALLNGDLIQKVVSLLSDEDPFVRWGSLQLLVAAGAKGALPAILARNEGTNREVIRAIGRLGGRAQRDLVAAALRSEDGLVRLEAAFAWARIADRAEELEAAERTWKGAAGLAAGFALVRMGRKDRAAAAALLREYVLRREEPDYQFLPDNLFDALAAGFEKNATAALSREVTAANRVNTVRDLETILAKAGVKVAEGTPALRRRLPAGATLTARRAIEWSFGSDLRLVPENGTISLLETDRALEIWQKRLDAP
jgi:HEAT repeat protein